MKFAAIALLAAATATAKICRNDTVCATNWVKKSCCSDFECNAFCDTIRCRQNTCGVTLCKKTAVEFTNTATIQRDIYGNVIAQQIQCKFPTSGQAWKPRMAEEIITELGYTYGDLLEEDDEENFEFMM